MFDIPKFKRSLTETIAYCSRQFNHQDLKNTLRTLLPPTFDRISYDAMQALVEPVIQIRSILVQHLIVPTQSEAEPVSITLQRGRLAAVRFDLLLYEGMASLETQGFFDSGPLPPCDTWVYAGSEIIDKHDVDYLIFWTPLEVHTLIQRAIDTDSVEGIGWLNEYRPALSFLPALRAEGLI